MFKTVKIPLTLLAMIGAFLLLCSPVWALQLSFNFAEDEIDVGESFTMDIVVSDLQDNEEVSFFNLNLNYDTSILMYTDYTLGNQLGNLDIGDAMDYSWGLTGNKLNIAEFSYLFDFNFQDDSFTLATISFIGRSAGVSEFFFSDVEIGDEYSNELLADLNSNSIRVNGTQPVPEPATLFLLGSGLLGILSTRRKCSK